MPSPRRVGSETSKTRDALLDSAERLMLDRGYAAVTYRNVAASGGVYAGLVSYYFPTLDDLFLALLRRRSERNLDRLVASLDARFDEPLRVVWEFNTDESSAALIMEFLALANHRKSIKAEITEVTRRVRKVQLEAIERHWSRCRMPDEMSPGTLLFLMATVPKMLQLEESVGICEAHTDTIRLVEHYLDDVEPKRPGRNGARRRPSARATA